jgi:hypothetical protein
MGNFYHSMIIWKTNNMVDSAPIIEDTGVIKLLYFLALYGMAFVL